MPQQQFETTVEAGERGRVFITIPFNPKEVWGQKSRYYVKGTLNDSAFQGSLGARKGTYFMPLNKELQERAEVTPGSVVKVTMEENLPQTEEIPEDLMQALANAPKAKQFFDGLTAFYRNQYIQWIEAAKKPETRAARLDETIAVLKEGKKQRS
jgi:Bacteriocin-protection, YdeI or OmpD-Associated/Domain of unknown function (DUF1905)